MPDASIKKSDVKLVTADNAVAPSGISYQGLVAAIGELLERARARIATEANTTLVETYWATGRYIVEYEQNGSDRAKYGSALLSSLARDLTLAHGRGFNRNNLQYMRKLYRHFPKCTTLSCKLGWSHYLEIQKCSDDLAIDFYCAECVRSNWNVRRQRAIATRTCHRNRRGGNEGPTYLISPFSPLFCYSIFCHARRVPRNNSTKETTDHQQLTTDN